MGQPPATFASSQSQIHIIGGSVSLNCVSPLNLWLSVHILNRGTGAYYTLPTPSLPCPRHKRSFRHAQMHTNNPKRNLNHDKAASGDLHCFHIPCRNCSHFRQRDHHLSIDPLLIRVSLKANLIIKIYS